MKVSLSWLIITLITVLTVYFFWKGCTLLTEPFTGGIYNKNDISINTCPKDTSSFVNPSGLTLCCNGTLLGSTCNGNEVCSLSGPSGGMPSCSYYFGQYLQSKGALFCPTSMPNYYESKDGSVRGCTEGSRRPDGTSPANPNAGKCTIYNNETDDNHKSDSCTNILRMERTSCFSSPNANNSANKSLHNDKHYGINSIPYIMCTYQANSGSNNCTDVSSYMESLLYEKKVGSNPDQIIQQINDSGDPLNKLKFCSVAELYSINRSITLDDIKDIDVFPNVKLPSQGGKPADRRARRLAEEEAARQRAEAAARAAAELAQRQAQLQQNMLMQESERQMAMVKKLNETMFLQSMNPFGGNFNPFASKESIEQQQLMRQLQELQNMRSRGGLTPQNLMELDGSITMIQTQLLHMNNMRQQRGY
jgi:hypothetical protein